jgi:hypothetical protein
MQEDIKNFVTKIFGDLNKTQIDYDTYRELNQNVSSEMFLSIMSILHEKLPVA